ncbi:hypothetical protein EXU57_06240 [Segetibacter sp. 3557_3]|uniref:hypothetical protein n=1 Tax=Segetibacter sp. 3557_3 TaxID=2547429 RepID=UPI001058F8B8|nr:hypothetical protein [Segetibacter sp. 3557_3]TDH28059.1 hypothetical protein EXU57_06240 [Segetibacter sp. 3557_3]
MLQHHRHFPVNWVDGMKISKDHFTRQDNAVQCQFHDVAALQLSAIRYGLLPSAGGANESFNVKIIADGHREVRVTVLSLDAITRGGARISIRSSNKHLQQESLSTWSFQVPPAVTPTNFWIFLITNPFERVPFGEPDPADFPPRLPYVAPAYSVQMLSSNEYRQFANHPFALPIGRISADVNSIAVQEYIPPCFSNAAHPDLTALHSDLDQFYAGLENSCLVILQNIYGKNQDNEVAKMVKDLCDKLLPFTAKTLNDLHWNALHDSPAAMLSTVTGFARIIKGTIDTRIGCGKEELMNYFSEWNHLNPGNLEGLINEVVSIWYDNHNITEAIEKISTFLKVITTLFNTLTELEFIGKRRKAVETFIKVEEQVPRRRFFG